MKSSLTLYRLALGGLALGLLLMSAGCGDSASASGRKFAGRYSADDSDLPPTAVKPAAAKTDTKAKPSAAAKPGAPAAKPVDDEPEGDSPEAAKAAAAKMAAANAAAAKLAAAGKLGAAGAKPKHPDDLTQWQPNDFFDARREKDVRLVKAIARLGKDAPDRDEAATLLVRLIQPDPPQVADDDKDKKDRDDGAALLNRVDVFAPPPALFELELPKGTTEPVPGLASGVVQVLANNGSSIARRAIHKILLGKLYTNCSDKLLTLAAIKALTDNFADRENQGVLYVLLTQPETVRPAVAGDVTARLIHQETSKLFQTIPTNVETMELRSKLGKFLCKESGSEATRKDLLALLIEPDLINFPAQVSLVSGARLDAKSRASLCTLLADYSRQATDRLLRLPATTEATSAGGTAETTVGGTAASPGMKIFRYEAYDDNGNSMVTGSNTDPIRGAAGATTGGTAGGAAGGAQAAAGTVAPYINTQRAVGVAQHLWNREFSDRVVGQLVEVGDISKAPELAALVASIPQDYTRWSALSMFQSRWKDGGEVFKQAGLNYERLRDPALLLAIKSNPRTPLNVERHVALRPTAATKAKFAELSKDEQVRGAWAGATIRMLVSLNRRFCAAALLPPGGHENDDDSAAVVQNDDDLKRLAQSVMRKDDAGSANSSGSRNMSAMVPPIPCPSGMHVLIAYQMKWPSDLPKALDSTNINPLEINYFQMETEDHSNKVSQYYERQLKGSTGWNFESGRWVDFLGTTEDGRLRSVDVVIRRVDKSLTVKNQIEKLNIELLWIETRDFTHSP